MQMLWFAGFVYLSTFCERLKWSREIVPKLPDTLAFPSNLTGADSDCMIRRHKHHVIPYDSAEHAECMHAWASRHLVQVLALRRGRSVLVGQAGGVAFAHTELAVQV
jgi:hypothetical protein